jgi:uncharacterized protein involved in exopolysaccharide biosynthesis
MDKLLTDHEQDIWSLDLRGFVELISARRWLVIGCVFFFTGALTTLAFVMSPVYEAEVVLIPANTERSLEQLGSALGQLGGIASLAGLGLGSRGQETEEALAVLRSRQFTEHFISDKNLMPVLFANKWDAARGEWKVPPQKQPTPAKAFKYFDKKVRTIVQDKKTGLVTLQIDWKSRAAAAEWANELARRLNEEMRTRSINKAESSLGYLEHELENTTTVATREAIGRLIEGQVKQRMVAHVTQEYAFRIVDRAMAPDADDPVKPKKALLIAAGFALGWLIALGWILLSYSLNPGRPLSRSSAG